MNPSPRWLYDWGIGIILWLQGASPALDTPFRLFTEMGSEMFVTILLPLLYLCVNRRAGLSAALLFGANTALNAAAKVLVNAPRPFQVDPRVQQLTHVSDSGWPSGHTQGAVGLWGYFAARRRRYGAGRWLTWLAVALMVLIPLSRLYLGVHFAGDLVGGYVLGALVLAGFLWLEGAPAEWFARQPLWAQLAIAAIVPMVGFALLPAGADNGVSALGTLLGGGIGAILERRWVRFAVGGPIWQRALRLAVGLVLLLALRFGLKAAFAGLDPAGLFRLLRYALVGLMLTFGAPWLLCRIGLAPREAEA